MYLGAERQSWEALFGGKGTYPVSGYGTEKTVGNGYGTGRLEELDG